jgi:hypothetical protein
MWSLAVGVAARVAHDLKSPALSAQPNRTNMIRNRLRFLAFSTPLLCATGLLGTLGCSGGLSTPTPCSNSTSPCGSSVDSGGSSTAGSSNAGSASAIGGASSAVGDTMSGGTMSGRSTVSGGAATGAGGSAASSGGAASDSAGSSSVPMPLGAIAYQQTFDALSTGPWKDVDSSKIKANPGNAQVTANCGADGSSCFRVTYRAVDGIHKQPYSSPVFSTSSGVIDWTASDTSHTNTATDVTQANISIDGSTDGKSSASAKAVPSKAYTLSYDLYFEPGFDFAKGGKLPGLAAAAFDSGCTEDGNAKRQPSNWSERLMWRANGRLQLYSYDQSRPSGSCGIERTIDEAAGDPQFELPGTIPSDDKFRLRSGVWYSIRLSVRVNDNESVKYLTDASGKSIVDLDGYLQPVSGNGEVSLSVKTADGAVKRHITFSNVALRDECNGPCPAQVPDSKDTWVNALFFSTFFGGNETKRTTCVDSDTSTLSSVVPNAPPSYPGLTPALFSTLCASQMNAAIYPKLTWNPSTPSAARFDNFVVNDGYTDAGF